MPSEPEYPYEDFIRDYRDFRETMRELLAEELPWRRYLPQYRAKWSGGAASAEVAQPPSKATAPGRKPKPKSGQK